MSTPPNNQGPSTGRSKGRQKVKLEKMEKKSNLQVTYSKRRSGLFKKASELCTLCGAEAAIVVFSPAEKAYCFGHPDVKTILERFENGDNNNNNTNVDPTIPPGNTALPTFSHERRSQQLLEAHRDSTIRELNLEYTQVEAMLRAERLRSQELKAMKKKGLAQHWIPPPLDGFNYDQLAILRESIMGFKKTVDDKVQKELMSIIGNDNHPPPLPDVGNYNQHINQHVFQAGVGTHENPNTMVFGHGGVGGDGNSNIDISGILPMFNTNDDINQHLLQGGEGTENPNPTVIGDGGGGVGENVDDINNISGLFPTFNNVAQPPMMNMGSGDLIGPWPGIGFGTNDAAQFQAPLDHHHDSMATNHNAPQYQAPLDQYQHDPMAVIGASGSGGGMFFGGGNNCSSSSAAAMLPNEPYNGGNAGFGTSGGFSGHEHGMF